MIPITTVDRSGWILSSIKDSLRWWLIKTTGSTQRIRYEPTNLSFSVLSWVDCGSVTKDLSNASGHSILDGRWKICQY